MGAAQRPSISPHVTGQQSAPYLQGDLYAFGSEAHGQRVGMQSVVIQRSREMGELEGSEGTEPIVIVFREEEVVPIPPELIVDRARIQEASTEATRLHQTLDGPRP